MRFTKIFRTKCLYVLAACLFVLSVFGFLQVLVLARAAELISDRNSSELLVAIFTYLSLVIFSAVFRAFCAYTSQLWELSANRAFVLCAAMELNGRTEWYADADAQGKRMGTISGNGLESVSGAITFFSQYLQQVMSLIGVAIGIGVAMSTSIFFATGASVVLSVLAAYVCQPTISKVVNEREESRIEVRKIILKMWINVTAGNDITKNRWEENFCNAFQSFKRLSLRFVALSAAIQFMLGFVVVFPYFIYAIYVLRGGSLFDMLIVFITLLPRMQELIGSSVKMVSMSVSFGALVSQLGAIKKAIKLPHIDKPFTRIEWKNIHITVNNNHFMFNNKEELFDFIFCHPGTRICIRGHNGSGKSTILLYLKKRFGGDAFYYENSDMLLAGNVTSQISKGQRARKQLIDITNVTKARILLLDEWTAHLDSKVTAEMDEILDCRGKRGTTIVEVRHDGRIASNNIDAQQSKR